MAWSKLGYKNVNSQNGSNTFVITVEGDYSLSGSTYTVKGRLVVYAKGAYTPYYSWGTNCCVTSFSIGGTAQTITSAQQQEPNADGDWITTDQSVNGVACKRYCVIGEWSRTIAATGSTQSVAISATYKCSYSQTYLPVQGTYTASGNLSLPGLTQYTVSYNANGGSSTPGSSTVIAGNSVTLASAISRQKTEASGTGSIVVSYNANGGSSTPGNTSGAWTDLSTTTYTFDKWALNGTGGTKYSAGASYTPTANCTMWATWTTSSGYTITYPKITLAAGISRANDTVTSYTVSYNANGGSSTPATQTATKTRSYTFKNWNTNSGGTGTSYNASTAYEFKANATLYAQWNSSDSGGSITLASAISRANGSTAGYSISYNANGGSNAPSSTTSGNRTVTYTFSKWAAGSAGGTTYSANTSYTPSANTTMYATWTSSTSANSSWTCSTQVPTRPGYTFLGWSTNSSATSATYTAGNTYTITSALTLYAVWQVNYYYLDLNGYLDGVNQSHIADYGKCDVYINGNKVATQITDYYTQHPYGTQYEFTNITPDWGCGYKGVQSGSLKGTIGVGDVSTRLSFIRYPVVVNANSDGQWKKGIVWINDNGEWKKARALNINNENEWKRLEKYDFTL